MSSKGKAAAPCGCPWSQVQWKTFWIIVTLVFIVLAIVAVCIGAAVNADPDAVQRYYVRGQGVEAPDALLEGYLITDSSANAVSYDFYYTGNVSTIQSILVRGPRAAGQRTGPIKFALCGFPNLVTVCDVFTVPGQVKGDPVKSLQPGPLDAHTQIADIRASPFKYYVEVLTSRFPAEPGGMRADLGSVGGVE